MNRREQRCGKASRSALSSFFDDKRWLERPDRAVDRLASLHATLHSGSGFSETELYHRAARVIRVGSRKGEAGVAIREGQDEGLAMRAIDRERKEMLFAAAAGSGDRSLRWIAEQPKGRPAPSELWARGAARLRDHDEQVRMPDARELSAWLEQARADLTERAAVRKNTHVPLELWVEVAATLESWVADGGLKASRTRARGWAVLRMSGSWGSGCTGKPVSLSCRSWRDLPTAGWGSLLEDRWIAPRTERIRPAGSIPVLFNPESSALLVRTLVRALHLHPGDPFDVGPAWDVADCPDRSTALFGGLFDDAGFPTRRTQLADGRHAVGSIEARGSLRRASFRDAPAPLPAHLVVRSNGGQPPPRCVLATSVFLHTLERDRWILEIAGALLNGGEAGPAVHATTVSVAPRELARRCVSAVGSPIPSHLGVETPALVFDGLRFG